MSYKESSDIAPSETVTFVKRITREIPCLVLDQGGGTHYSSHRLLTRCVYGIHLAEYDNNSDRWIIIPRFYPRSLYRTCMKVSERKGELGDLDKKVEANERKLSKQQSDSDDQLNRARHISLGLKQR